MIPGNDFFVAGPFASASIHQQDFVDGLYFTALFVDSLRERSKIEKALTIAIEQENVDLAAQKRTELDYLDGIFRLTLEIHPAGGLDS
jgi:hypothetical protein